MVDLAPTVCAMAGCHLGPYPTGQRRPDGRSVLDAFALGAPTGRRSLLSSHPEDGWHEPGHPGWFALRTDATHPLGAWLFVHYHTGEEELYDLSRDPHLLDNLARRNDVRLTRVALENALLRRLGGRYRWR
jgi:arylsulfatase A-like enzyme